MFPLLACALSGVDGAYFGTTFPHLFFMTYKGLVPDPPEKTFVPRVFGFRVRARHPSGGAAAAARGQGEHHEQRLQEGRRLRRPHPPPSPSQQQPSGAAASAAATAAGATAVAVAGCAGSSNGERGAAEAGGEGGRKGLAKAGGKGGSVVVRIKEEEEVNGTEGRTGKVEVVGREVAGGGHGAESGNQAR